jgi:hypothetical protein
MLNPSFFVTSMSYFSASSVGAVYSPSGQKPWSSGPYWKRNLLFSRMRVIPFSSLPRDILRMPK